MAGKAYAQNLARWKWLIVYLESRFILLIGFDKLVVDASHRFLEVLPPHCLLVLGLKLNVFHFITKGWNFLDSWWYLSFEEEKKLTMKKKVISKETIIPFSKIISQGFIMLRREIHSIFHLGEANPKKKECSKIFSSLFILFSAYYIPQLFVGRAKCKQ